MKKIALINGPNLNLLGRRQPEIYGNKGFESWLEELRQRFPEAALDYFQSNHEGELVEHLQAIGWQRAGIALNAAAYTHTSVALADAVAAIPAPVVEVHISNVFAREAFRHQSYLAPYCQGSLAGFGLEGYAMAIQYFLNCTPQNQEH